MKSPIPKKMVKESFTVCDVEATTVESCGMVKSEGIAIDDAYWLNNFDHITSGEGLVARNAPASTEECSNNSKGNKEGKGHAERKFPARYGRVNEAA
jgi:hypothetical protein